jgi:DNA-binding NarL/FixJ family response regulator
LGLPEAKLLKKYFRDATDGVLLKSVEAGELLSAIDKSLAGEKYIQKKLQDTVFNNWLSPAIKRTNQKLTAREKEILQLIVEEYTSKEIADKLFIGHCTAETHRLNLIQKLGVKNTAGLVREAIQLQLI